MPRAAGTSTATPRARDSGRRGLPLVLTTLAYIAAGLLSIWLQVAPRQGAPQSLATAIALAGVLVYGGRMLIGIGVGALALALVAHGLAGRHGATIVVVSLVSAIGAVAEAAVGAMLIRRFVRQPLTLSGPVDIVAFLAACAATSLVRATFVVAALGVGGVVASAKLLALWGSAVLGDLAGLFIITPVILTLIGRPRADWAARRLPVGLTMTLVLAFLVLGIVQSTRWNEERMRAGFERDASGASLILASQLEEPLRALEALRGVFAISHRPSRAEMHKVTARWLESGSVSAMGWSERVRHDDLQSFETRARAEGLVGYRVFDRGDGTTAGEAVPAQPAAAPEAETRDAFAVRLIDPALVNTPALGVNSLSIPAARAAILQSVESGLPAATTAFRLTQTAAEDPRLGTVVYQAVYDGDATTAAERRNAVRGAVFVTLTMDAQLDSLAGKVPGYLRLCVVDAQPGATPRRLGGAPGCESERAPLTHVRPLAFAGRQWELRVSSLSAAVSDSATRSAWIFACVGLLSAAMLGSSLLITTGRARRIESAVHERTAALRAEVTERQLAETALRASEERFRNILDNVPIGVVYTDLGGRVIQANPRYCELTGYSEGELNALSPTALTHPDDVHSEESLTAQLVAGEIPLYSRHKRCVNRAGEVVWVRSTVSLLRDPRHAPWRIVGVVEDITEHLRLEVAERAREAAEASNRAKSEFLSRMSHELRTPLNAMLGFAQLLDIDRRHPLTAVQRPWVAQIQQAGWHLLEMINDVLDLSRIESGNLRLESTSVDLAAIVRSTIALVSSDADRRSIRISEALVPESLAVLGDATRVKQILTNLLSNAVKYNVDNGRVHIASRLAAPDVVEISVTDTGLGMTPEQMAELFRPFNRLGRERTDLEGTGIGLVISRRLAEVMGGSIRVKSVPGEGSSFILKLPKAVDPDTVRSMLDEFESLPPEYHRRIVHYIEDNETNVEVMRGILAQRDQVQMEVSMTGGEGLAGVRARLPHLILLDMHLPDLTGLELLACLKADPATAAIPVVVVSADATAQQIDAALDAGAVRYLTKPFAVNELLATIDDLLDRMDTGFGEARV